MKLVLLSLYSALLSGSEPTFDGQRVPSGLHFRWSFSPELGFPKGGFWLCRKPSRTRGECLEPPEALIWDQDVDPCVPPGSTGMVWGEPDWEGWQMLWPPFVLPLTSTNPNWTTRYQGAPQPTAPDVVERDIAEAQRRLGQLQLEPGTDNARHLRDLRNTLARLVSSFPNGLLFDQKIERSSDPTAPNQFDLSLMEQLLMLAVHPHLAKVLGLYGVMPSSMVAEPYDYCLVGRWGDTSCAARLVTLGLAPATALKEGDARIAGVHLSIDRTTGRLTGWVGQPPGSVVPVTSQVSLRVEEIVSKLPTEERPAALLTMSATGSGMTRSSVRLPNPVGEIEVQIAGAGQVTALGEGVELISQSVSGNQLTTLTLRSPRPEMQPIDQLTFTTSSFLVLGQLRLWIVPRGAIGNLYAMFPEPRAVPPLAAPATPLLTMRDRQPEFDPPPTPPRLIPYSTVDISWDAPPRDREKDPMQQITGTPPNEPIGFIADRLEGDRIERVPQLITPISQPRSATDPTRVYCVLHRTTDPSAPLRYRIAGFNSFGVLGAMSIPSNPLRISPQVASPIVQVVQFDNSTEAGGRDSTSPLGWRGGTLQAAIRIDGADFYTYPDTRVVRVFVEQMTPTKTLLLTQDITLPEPQVLAARVTDIQQVTRKVGNQPRDEFQITTEPPLAANLNQGISAFLILVGRSPDNLPIIDRYVVQPESDETGNSPVLRVPAFGNSPLARSRDRFQNQQAYLVLGYAQVLTLSLPSLLVSVEQPHIRCQIYAQSAAQPSLLLSTVDADTPEFPNSAKAQFTAPQRWIPPRPPLPPQLAPSHIVHHEYFDPPDFYGKARITKLPFATPPLADDNPPQTDPNKQRSGYILLRSPAHTLFLTDLERRRKLSNFADPKPSIIEANGTARTDLDAWIKMLPEWLAAYKLRRPADKPLASSDVLTDEDAQREFIEHFYNGLLDDELRSLANLPENLSAFARVSPDPLPPQGDSPLSDAIEGQGFGRVLYKLQALSKAVNSSEVTLSAGPYYTRLTAPPPSPGLIKVSAAGAALIPVWTLSEDPETAAYLVYRADSPDKLKDLRFFGSDPATINLSKLSKLNHDPKQWLSLSFGEGEIDPRIIALVPDPRLFARDYDGSMMAEVILSAGIAPSEVLGVYRANQFFEDESPENQPQAFNYFRPTNKGGLSQLIVESGQARITGLRVGLGRSVEVVVVVRVDGGIRVLGALPVQRASFYDGGEPGNPLDRTTENAYVVVGVDRFGNRSRPSPAFIVQPF